MELDGAIENVAREQGGVLDLGKALDGDWEEVRIVQGHRPGQVPLNCPFGWDMTWRERQALIDAGLYTIVGLFKRDVFQRYIEYSGERAVFQGDVKSVARQRAQFKVTGNSRPYELSLMP